MLLQRREVFAVYAIFLTWTASCVFGYLQLIIIFSKVMEAEKAKTDSEAEHLQRAAFYTAAEQACQRLEKRLKKHVVKAQPYFEQKEAFNKALEAQKEQVQSLQLKVNSSIFENINSAINFQLFN